MDPAPACPAFDREFALERQTCEASGRGMQPRRFIDLSGRKASSMELSWSGIGGGPYRDGGINPPASKRAKCVLSSRGYMPFALSERIRRGDLLGRDGTYSRRPGRVFESDAGTETGRISAGDISFRPATAASPVGCVARTTRRFRAIGIRACKRGVFDRWFEEPVRRGWRGPD